VADPLKNLFDERAIRALARDLRRAHPRLSERGFVAACLRGLDELSLTARAAHIAEVMRRTLPEDFVAAAEILLRSLGPELASSDVFGLEPLLYMPHAVFVARFGLDHFEVSMRLQYELTKRFSAEGSIRAFLVKYPEATYERLIAWAKDPNVHVRRLVSEGTRPRLPWAPRLREFQRDPRPVIALLELLKDDPERYVQRSVANNLNDIGKDHPDVAVDLCQAWSNGAPEGRRWIVKHALRSLVKKGHRGALATLGVSAAPRVRVRAPKFEPRSVAIGGSLCVSFEIASTADVHQDLLVDYAVHFVKANGSRRAKVFKLRRLVLQGSARVRLDARVSFASMTTRKHYPGTHALDVLVNGETFPLGEFEVRG
jgi:3-methyladenine DNA glycosylase AlkC